MRGAGDVAAEGPKSKTCRSIRGLQSIEADMYQRSDTLVRMTSRHHLEGGGGNLVRNSSADWRRPRRWQTKGQDFTAAPPGKQRPLEDIDQETPIMKPIELDSRAVRFGLYRSGKYTVRSARPLEINPSSTSRNGAWAARNKPKLLTAAHADYGDAEGKGRDV